MSPRRPAIGVITEAQSRYALRIQAAPVVVVFRSCWIVSSAGRDERLQQRVRNGRGGKQREGDVVVLSLDPVIHQPAVFTIGHGTRAVEELIACLDESGVRTLVDVRRFPGSRRNPQFGQARLTASLEEAGIAYRHAEELGGRLSGRARRGALRLHQRRRPSAATRREWAPAQWQEALASALAEPVPCFMCAETLWTKCHRRLIAELLQARGHQVVHLLAPGPPGAAQALGRSRIPWC